MDEIAGAKTAPLSIHYTIMTPGETLILVVILAGALMAVGILLLAILKLAGIPTGIIVLFLILARLLALTKTLIWREPKSQTECPLPNAKTDQDEEKLIATKVEGV